MIVVIQTHMAIYVTTIRKWFVTTAERTICAQQVHILCTCIWLFKFANFEPAMYTEYSFTFHRTYTVQLFDDCCNSEHYLRNKYAWTQDDSDELIRLKCGYVKSGVWRFAYQYKQKSLHIYLGITILPAHLTLVLVHA